MLSLQNLKQKLKRQKKGLRDLLHLRAREHGPRDAQDDLYQDDPDEKRDEKVDDVQPVIEKKGFQAGDDLLPQREFLRRSRFRSQ